MQPTYLRLTFSLCALALYALVPAAEAVTLAPGDIVMTTEASPPSNANEVYKVDPTSGARTLVASIIPANGYLAGIAIEPSGQLLVTQIDTVGSCPNKYTRVLRVDPASGNSTTVTNACNGFVDEFGNPTGVATDGSQIFFTAVGQRDVWQMNVDGSARSKLSSGSLLVSPYDLALVPGGMYVSSDDTGFSDINSIVFVQRPSGGQVLISSGGILRDLRGMALEADGNLVVISELGDITNPDSVIRVHPGTGAQTTVSTGDHLMAGNDIAVEYDGHLLVANTQSPAAVIRIDPGSGAQSILTSGTPVPLAIAVVPGPPASCGNNDVESGEACDDGNTNPGDCCSATCQYEASGAACGSLTDTGCDNPDTCNASGVCQTNNEPNTTVCRAAAGPCDLPENCAGNGTACPEDGFASGTTECRASAGICDVAENCTGSTAACPGDALESSATVCRVSAGACDIAESCTGATATCPSNVFLSSATTCRVSGGVCDIAENCTGLDASCPSDSLSPSTQACRPSAGTCDVPENCTGSSASCPADIRAPSTQECRPVAGPCDLPEVCTGSSADCPSDSLASQGTPCRSAAGQCDEPETCTGDAADCPADSKAANTTACRATTGTCDASEYCDGTGNTCPIDSGAPACGISDFCCPGTCGANEDPDCCNNSITFSNCQIKPSIAVGKPDKYRVSCSVLDATASTNGLHLDTDPLWLVIRDATTSPAACLEELLSPGPCIGDICDTGTFELESCSEDRDCRPCRQTGSGFLCKGKPRTPGISKVALKLLRDGSGRRYKLVMTGSTTDIQCSFASLPWSLGIVQGDDCGDVACTQIDGSRISCLGVP